MTGERLVYDVLIIGSGCAGMSLALSLAQADPNVSIAVVSKAALTDSNSTYAQGGVAAVTDQQDSVQQHVDDTLLCGGGLTNPPIVEHIISGSVEAIQFLQQHGVAFDRDARGQLMLGHEGGHSQRRILHCADHTGREIMNQLLRAAREYPNIHLFEHRVAMDVMNQHTHSACDHDRVIGAEFLDTRDHQIETLLAKATVLATGGSGKAYRFTSNPDVATGDGVAMAHRAGACIVNMEYYQFHPTLLYHPKVNNFLLTEALRGEGAYLLDADHRQRFMQKYDSRKELATRDVVSRAIHEQILMSEHDFVYMDVRHFDQAQFKQRFPSIFSTLRRCDIDPGRDLIPVVPAAHYQCGGIEVNEYGQSSVSGLYALGEVACTGLHGANRLASNSLLECVVCAQTCAKQLLNTIASIKTVPAFDNQIRKVPSHSHRYHWTTPLWQTIRREMSTYAGIVRDEQGLTYLMKQLQTMSGHIQRELEHEVIDRETIELINMHQVAQLITQSALHNTVSAGSHYRQDKQPTVFGEQAC